jgi:lipoprotein-releasing system permease protein
MTYALRIGLRYLRSTRHGTISVITFIAVTGVALGVAALLTVQAITSGFQQEFRDKVLGVNAHVLVLKYGLDFDEYRDVIAMAEPMAQVTGAAPFLINEMMLAKGDRLSGVLVKGVDPERVGLVLDVPNQLVEGSMEGLRRPGAAPPLKPDQLDRPMAGDDLDAVLRDILEREQPAVETAGDEEEAPLDESASEDLRERIARGEDIPPEALEPPARRQPVWARGIEPAAEGALPDVEVPSAQDVERLLGAMDDDAFALPDEALEAQMLAEELLAIEEEKEGELPGIVVGATLAANLGLELGDRVKVISPLTGLDVSMWAPEARVPRSRDFRVIGVFEAGFQEYDTRLVYVDLFEAQRFHEHGDAVTGVEMRVRDIDQARNVARELERKLAGPFHTMDWAELNHNLFTALEIQKIMLSLVIASIIIVAAFNVIATLIMVVLEKKREIAILKAMGATDGAVLLVFLVQGAIIGVVGTLIGLALGGGIIAYLMTYQFPLDPKVYLIDHLPLIVSPTEFLVTTLVALGICLGATLVPSWWAARLLPADGVRYE